VGQTACLRFC